MKCIKATIGIILNLFSNTYIQCVDCVQLDIAIRTELMYSIEANSVCSQ